MRMKNAFLSAALAALLLPHLALWADEAPAHTDMPGVQAIDLTRLLAPPPAEDSQQGKDELQQVLDLQAKRTDAEAAACVADQEYSVFRFTDVVGPAFDAAVLPKTAAYFSAAVDAAKATVDASKGHWDRRRPFLVDSRVQPCDKPSKSASYPSGHATAGTVMAILLADLVPEKQAAIYARGWLFAQHRVMGGVHFPSDIAAGRIAGTVVAQAILADPGMQAMARQARAELRSALKLDGNQAP
ncbi:MAG TPA: phosphatase PAP2 family protein [bacterium]|nr:phosphatase PAP2 family protein [bacterium]